MEKKINLLFLFLFLFLSTITLQFPATESTNVSAIYAFGDSVFDAGNNNYLATICRSTHPPYGIDFPDKTPTGRFSNGRLPADILIADLGIKKLLPAYSEATLLDADLLTGVSFASACSGLDDLTAAEAGVLTMTTQFRNFQKAFEKMHRNFGLEKTVRAVENALFLVSAGSNDMMDNYYVLPIRQMMYSLSVYHDRLIRNLDDIVKKLHNAGAKRMVVLGLPPLGCLPTDVTTNKVNKSGDLFRRDCNSKHNSDAQEYNTKLESLVKQRKEDLPKLKLAYMDIYTPLMDMINNPNSFGFKSVHEGCCGTGSIEVGPLCSELTYTCHQRSEYLFFDASHPTQAAYEGLTKIFKEKVLPDLLK